MIILGLKGTTSGQVKDQVSLVHDDIVFSDLTTHEQGC